MMRCNHLHLKRVLTTILKYKFKMPTSDFATKVITVMPQMTCFQVVLAENKHVPLENTCLTTEQSKKLAASIANLDSTVTH